MGIKIRLLEANAKIGGCCATTDIGGYTFNGGAQRQRLYRQAETILASEAPILPLTYHRWYALLKPRVNSFPMSAMRRWFLKDVVVALD
jgi:phytoene dehydrogenase-like protein